MCSTTCHGSPALGNGHGRHFFRAQGATATVPLPADQDPTWHIPLEHCQLSQEVPWPRRCAKRWGLKCLETLFCASSCYEMSWYKCPAGDSPQAVGTVQPGEAAAAAGAPVPWPRVYFSAPAATGCPRRHGTGHAPAPPLSWACAGTRLLHPREPCVAGAASACVPHAWGLGSQDTAEQGCASLALHAPQPSSRLHTEHSPILPWALTPPPSTHTLWSPTCTLCIEAIHPAPMHCP